MGIIDRLACLAASTVVAALSIGATIALYEGLSIPSAVPLIGGTALIDGIADRRVKSALNGYVALTEKTAADARAAREKQLREAAERQLAAEQARAVIAEKAKADSDARLNKMIEDDRANSQDPADYWNDRELDWLRHH